MPEGLNALARECHDNSVAHGFWGDEQTHPGMVDEAVFPLKLMLVVSELSEALEDYRKGYPLSEHRYQYTFSGAGPASTFNSVLYSTGRFTETRTRNGEDGWPEQYEYELTHEDLSRTATDTKPYGVPSEIADAIIRCLDLAAAYGMDIEKAVREKMDYNRGRPYLHGKKC